MGATFRPFQSGNSGNSNNMRIEDEKFLAALVLALGVVVAFQFEGLASGFTGFLMPSLFCVMVFLNSL